MKRFHDRELILTPEDSKTFLEFLLHRCDVEKCPPYVENITWRCFTRIEDRHLLLTFLPETYKALQSFAKILKEDENALRIKGRQNVSTSNVSSLYDETEVEDECSETVGKFWRSRRSSEGSCVDLSIFVYDFSLSSFMENKLFEDILLDYRDSLGEFGSNPDLHTSKELTHHCIIVYDMFLYCFVSTVFESLRKNEFVDDDNVDETLAICSDNIPEEIDIFGFLGSICGHIKHASIGEKDCEESLEDWDRAHERNAIEFLRGQIVKRNESVWAPNCEELLGLHDFIQKRFDKVLKKYFSPIPNKKDHYFYNPDFLKDFSQVCFQFILMNIQPLYLPLFPNSFIFCSKSLEHLFT